MSGEVVLVHADEALLVFNKPSGLLSVPGRGTDKLDSLSQRVMQRYPQAKVVHRLDRDTSGLLLMAQGATMQSCLSKAFANRQVKKRYTAVCHGLVREQEPGCWHTIDLPIWLDWAIRPKRQIDPKGQPSLTRWRLLAHQIEANTSRLELEPYTGRTHQLRVHLHALGHPMMGDTLYAPAEVQSLSPRLLLHASQLELQHPLTGEPLSWDSPAPF
jgi:tRNA pseudouridine32 synthase/23S rRNA pseudouridine746 synthase